MTPERLAGLIELVDSGAVTTQVAKDVFERMVESGRAAKEIVEEAGLGQISGEDEVLGIVRKVIAANEKAVADYQAAQRNYDCPCLTEGAYQHYVKAFYDRSAAHDRFKWAAEKYTLAITYTIVPPP